MCLRNILQVVNCTWVSRPMASKALRVGLFIEKEIVDNSANIWKLSNPVSQLGILSFLKTYSQEYMSGLR